MRDQKKKSKGRLWKLLSWIACIGLLLSYAGTFISPADFKGLFLFAISYPLWFLSTIISLLFWAFRKSKFVLVPLLALLLGWPIHGRFIQLLPKFQNEVPEAESKLKVLTYNVRLFDLYNWSKNTETRDKIIDLLVDQKADVMCFQEFYHTEREGVFETKNTLLKLMPVKYYHEKYTHKMHGDQYFGVVTFSKYPIVNRGFIPFETDYNNFCIYSDILVDKDTIRVYNTHLASIRFQKEDYKFMEVGGEEQDKIEGGQRILSRLTSAAVNRSEQAEKVSQSIAESPYPVILCGDFNDTPVSFTYRTLRENLEDSFIAKGSGIGNTYIGAFPSFRIDYILHSERIKARAYKTLPEKYSDHHAVTVDFSWE